MEIEAQLESLDKKIEKYNKKTDKLSELVGSLVSAVEQNSSEEKSAGIKELFDELKNDYSKNQKGLNKKITELKTAITKANDTIENFSQNSVENIDINRLETLFDEFKTNSDLSNQTVNNGIEKIENMLNEYNQGLQSINLSSDNSEKIKEAVKSLNDGFYFELLQLFNSISFEGEAQDLKDFMEEILSSVTLKTDENTEKLNNIMLQFKKLLNKIEGIEKAQNSISDYLKPEEANDLVYSFDDIQSDLAKMRLVLNDISSSISSQDIIEEISEKIKQTSEQVENVSKLLVASSDTEDGAVGIGKKIENLNEQVYDISLRTNKLLLTNEDSTTELKNNLELFKEVFDKANPEKIYELFYELTHYFNDVNERINEVSQTARASHAEAVTIKNALIHVGEWLDGASSVLEEIRSNTTAGGNSNINNADIKSYMEEFSKTQQTIGDAFINLGERLNNYQEHTQRRLAEIDEKLSQIINFSSNRDSSSAVLSRLDNIDQRFIEMENILSLLSEKIMKE